MKKWHIPKEVKDLRYPNEILQQFADSLYKDSDKKLTGQVTEQISYDTEDRPKFIYALHVYVNKLKQSFRLFEIEQLTEKPYPVNLKVILYTGSENFDNIISATALDRKLDSLSQNKLVRNLLAHFIRLSDLKEE